jgi:CHAT domain-containing protein/tetratricopeptide (TPR) repeat protein
MSGEATAERYLGETIAPEILLVPLSDADSAEIINRLKLEADRHWDIDPRRSLEFAARIIAIGKARQDACQTALGMMARGDALKLLGDTNEAWEMLEQAGKMFLTAGDEVGWARTRIGRLHLGIMLNRLDETLADAERARQILRLHGEIDKLMRLTFQTAYTYNYLGDHRKTLELYRSALVMAEQVGETGQIYIGKITHNMGVAFQNLGEVEQAREYYERSRTFFTDRGEPTLLAIAETSLAMIAQDQGHYRQALELLNQAVTRVPDYEELDIAKVKTHILDCHINLHRLSEARELARQIVDVFRRDNDLFELSRALLQLATVEAELANFNAARDALDEAEAIFASEKAQLWLAITWLKRGQIALHQGDPQAAYQYAEDAAVSFNNAGQRINCTTAIMLQGQASLALGDYLAAENLAGSVLLIGQRYAMPSLRYTAHLLLGQVAEQQAYFTRAQRHYQAAVATSERVQRCLTITLRPGFLEDKFEAWRRLIGMHLNAGRASRAFETLERAKSQVLLGYLANREGLRWSRGDPHSQALIAELDRLRSEHQWYYQQAHALPSDLHTLRSSTFEASLREAKGREHRMREITEQLYLHSEGSRIENPAPTPSLEEIQRTLDEDTLLVEFYNDGSEFWAFTVDREMIEAHDLHLGVNALEQLQAQLRVNICSALTVCPHSQASDNLTTHAKRILGRLYTLLIQPLPLKGRDKHRLVIVPYGLLHALPFHLLYDGSTYLIENCEVVILPAAGLATQAGPRRQAGALVLAHSWEGRLPHTQNEAQTVQQLLGGDLFMEQAANRAALERPPCQVLHIATHGEFRLDQPDLSYIQLADGQLYADDLFQQDLSYELVTLSACETGQAKASGGDELIGLGRGFLYTGAGALVVSLWQVADETTARLMEVMYKQLKEGDAKPAALRAAQRSILAEDACLHPAYWGSFEFIGNTSPLSNDVDTR